jgi:hypothetical protein
MGTQRDQDRADFNPLLAYPGKPLGPQVRSFEEVSAHFSVFKVVRETFFPAYTGRSDTE